MTVPQEAAPVKEADATARLQDTFAAVEFLRSFDPHGRHNLVAIDPTGGAPEGRTFEPGDWTGMEKWIDARNGRMNLYFSLNEPKAGAPHGKLRKEHIGRIRAVCADIDPRPDEEKKPGGFAAERKRLEKLADDLEREAAPTFLIDTGNGIQPVWKLTSPEALLREMLA